MKQTIDESLFIQAFENYDRVNNFGYPGLRALFEYIEEYEEGCGGQIELDVIALCCDFTQYDAIQEALEDYGLETLEELEENTTVIFYNVHGRCRHSEASLIVLNY